MLRSPMEMGMPQNFTQISWGVRKKFQITNLAMPNNMSSMKKALKSVPGQADVEVPNGDGDGARTPPRCLEGNSLVWPYPCLRLKFVPCHNTRFMQEWTRIFRSPPFCSDDSLLQRAKAKAKEKGSSWPLEANIRKSVHTTMISVKNWTRIRL